MKEKLKAQHHILEELVGDYVSGRLFDIELEPYLSQIDVEEEASIWVLGAGKASVKMAAKVEAYFGNRVKDGIIIAPEKSRELSEIQVFNGSHPLPDRDSVSASYELMELASKIPARDTVIFCLSGGASSLFAIPPEGVELHELQLTWKLLLESGASINEMNIVRKHVSVSSGGRLGDILSATNLVSLILSDVPDNNPEIIGSGPTVGDTSTFKETFQILKRYKLWDEVPHSIRIHITRGMHGDQPETPVDLPVWHKIHVISGAKVLAQNAEQRLSLQNYTTLLADEAYDQDVKQVSKEICGKAISVVSGKDEIKKPAALIYFGESTVEVSGDGKGGRNMHLALNAAISMEGQHHISLLSLATDGVDGPTDAAGAIVNSETTLKARKKKLNPEDYLQQNDSYHFHQEMGTLVMTGPTGNNVMDLQVVLVD